MIHVVNHARYPKQGQSAFKSPNKDGALAAHVEAQDF